MRVAVNAWFIDAPEAHLIGLGQYTHHLLAALPEASAGIEVARIVPPGRGRISKTFAKVWFEQAGFPSRARRAQADVAFVPYWAPPRRCTLPVVVTIHDVIPLAVPYYGSGPIGRPYTTLNRRSAAKAEAIITDSEYSKRDLIEHLRVDESRVTAIPLAADDRFRPDISAGDAESVRERLKLPDRYVLYLSGFDPRKNVETLLQAYAKATRTLGRELPLVINGLPETRVRTRDGHQVEMRRLADALGITETIRFVGRVAEADKPTLYAGAHAFLYPSTYEGFGLPALEAMACGAPVVGSNATSIPEIVGPGGLLVDPLDAHAMAEALVVVCTDSSMHARLRAAALAQASTFSWQRTARETGVVLRDAAGVR